MEHPKFPSRARKRPSRPPTPPPPSPTNPNRTPYRAPHPPPFGPTNLNPALFNPPPYSPTNLNPFRPPPFEHPLIPGFGAGKLAAHGPGGGGGAGGAPGHYPGFLSRSQLQAEAIREAALSYSPQRQELLRQQAESNQLAARQGQAIQGFSLATANALASAGPNVTAAYQKAAQDTASFGKGYSDGLRSVQDKSAAEGNAYLTSVGGADAGTTPIQGDHGAADVLYGLGGAIPASTLEREGAAFGAAASAYPRTALGQGRETQLKSIWDARHTNEQYNARLRDIAANQGGSVVTGLFRLKQSELQKRQYYDSLKTNKDARAAALSSHRSDVAIQQANRKQDIAYRNRIESDRAVAAKRHDDQVVAYQNQKAAADAKQAEYLQGKLDQQTARDDSSKALAWSKINGFASNPDGSLIKGADGKPIPTAATSEYNLTTRRYYDTLDETNRHNKANEGNAADSISQRAEAARVKAAAATQTAADKKAKLKLPNSELSRTKGYIVDSYGKPILGPNGKKQLVATTTTGGNPTQKRDAYLSKMQKALFTLGNSGRGKPIASPVTPGAYVGKNGKTTFNANLAQRSGVKSYKQIYETVYAQYVPTLIHLYGYKDAQARKIIDARLRKLGYTPGKK